MQGVVGAGPAELPARHLTLDLVVADDVDTGGSDGLLLSATLKSTLDAVPAGKSKLEMPDRVVTARDTEMGDWPPQPTW